MRSRTEKNKGWGIENKSLSLLLLCCLSETGMKILYCLTQSNKGDGSMAHGEIRLSCGAVATLPFDTAA